MMLLGIDPGQVTGWVTYCTAARRVIAAGTFADHLLPASDAVPSWSDCLEVVIERPVAHGPTRPQVVECARIEGRIVQHFAMTRDPGTVHELTRREVKRALTDATQRDVVVTDDATAWAALKLLHGGEGCDARPRVKKGVEIAPGGPLGGVTSHERAALATCFAWWLLQAKAIETATPNR